MCGVCAWCAPCAALVCCSRGGVEGLPRGGCGNFCKPAANGSESHALTQPVCPQPLLCCCGLPLGSTRGREPEGQKPHKADVAGFGAREIRLRGQLTVSPISVCSRPASCSRRRFCRLYYFVTCRIELKHVQGELPVRQSPLRPQREGPAPGANRVPSKATGCDRTPFLLQDTLYQLNGTLPLNQQGRFNI